LSIHVLACSGLIPFGHNTLREVRLFGISILAGCFLKKTLFRWGVIDHNVSMFPTPGCAFNFATSALVTTGKKTGECATRVHITGARRRKNSTETPAKNIKWVTGWGTVVLLDDPAPLAAVRPKLARHILNSSCVSPFLRQTT
jgi:hypothetical protein